MSLRSYLQLAAGLALFALVLFVGLWSGPRWMGVNARPLDRAYWVRSDEPVLSRARFVWTQLSVNARALAMHVFPPRTLSGTVVAVHDDVASLPWPLPDPSTFEVVLRAAFEVPEDDAWAEWSYPARERLAVVYRARVAPDGTFTLRRPKGALLFDVAVEGDFVASASVESQANTWAEPRFVVGSGGDPAWGELRIGARPAGVVTLHATLDGGPATGLEGRFLEWTHRPGFIGCFGQRDPASSGQETIEEGGLESPSIARFDANGIQRCAGVLPGAVDFAPSLGGVGPTLFVRGPLGVELAAGGDVSIEVPLLRPRTLTGRVVDVGGEPLAGVSVRQHVDAGRPPFHSWCSEGTTDAEGRFELEVPPDWALGTLSLQADPESALTGFRGTDLADRYADGDAKFVLGSGAPADPTGTAEFRVTNAVGERVLALVAPAVPGFAVENLRDGLVFCTPAPGGTRVHEGKAELTPGRYEARAVLQSARNGPNSDADAPPAMWNQVSAPIEFEVQASGAVTIDLPLPDLVPVVVRAVDAEGTPLADAWMVVQQLEGTLTSVCMGRADAVGSFQVAGLLPGRYRAQCDSDLCVGSTTFDVQPGDRLTVEVVAAARACLDVESETPVEAYAQPLGPVEVGLALVERWMLPSDLPAGRYLLTAWEDGDVIARRTVDLAPGERSTWRVERAAPVPARFSGTVRTGGAPVSGLEVRLRDPFGDVSKHTIDARGAFELAGWTEGPWTLELWGASNTRLHDWGLVRTRPLAASRGDHDLGCIDLPTSSMRVRVQGVYDREVEALIATADDGTERSAIWASSGYWFPFLAPGAYTVHAAAPDGTPRPDYAPVRVQVGPGETVGGIVLAPRGVR